MKHIKLFENRIIQWIVIYIPLEQPYSYSVSLFDDINSAENYYIEFVNELILEKNAMKRIFFIEGGRSDNKNSIQISNIEDAKNWLYDNPEYIVDIQSIENQGKYDLPYELQIARDTKKYNI